VLHHDRDAQRERQIYQVEAVANWIRNLGYLVECGRYRCITWEDADAAGDPRCGGAYRGSNYVIMNIIGADGNYVYGNGPDPVSETDGRISRAPNSSYTRHEEERDLCGHRTILELARSDGPPRHLVLEHEFNRLTEEQLREQISLGARSQKWTSLGSVDEAWLRGRSTLGNTLPTDIVEALRMFNSGKNVKFFQDPDYEFWIPDNMDELPEACPVAVAVDVGPVAVAVDVGPVAVDHLLASGNSSESSESSEIPQFRFVFFFLARPLSQRTIPTFFIGDALVYTRHRRIPQTTSPARQSRIQ
jgi:hypothetical protein